MSLVARACRDFMSAWGLLQSRWIARQKEVVWMGRPHTRSQQESISLRPVRSYLIGLRTTCIEWRTFQLVPDRVQRVRHFECSCEVYLSRMPFMLEFQLRSKLVKAPRSKTGNACGFWLDGPGPTCCCSFGALYGTKGPTKRSQFVCSQRKCYHHETSLPVPHSALGATQFGTLCLIAINSSTGRCSIFLTYCQLVSDDSACGDIRLRASRQC
jgi:hypothetical protein